MCQYHGKYNYSFINILKIKNKLIFLNEKKEILKYISQCNKREVTHFNYIFLNYNGRFGNQLILLNKVIFYCEILRCKKIILNKKYNSFIKTKILYKRYKMSIELGNKNNYNYKKIIFDKTNFFFWYFKNIYPPYRNEIIKKEILKNLPKLKIDINDLYIYIRSGDIFENFHLHYFQPPLCFYEYILNNFKFKKIFIISENKNNPVINYLIKKYPYIVYNKKLLKLDISNLLYSYNIVGAYSTFLKIIIKLNDNIRLFLLFEFSVNLIYSFFFSYEFNHKNIIIYIMKDNNYYKNIKKSKNVKILKNLMLKYKCKNKFNFFK